QETGVAVRVQPAQPEQGERHEQQGFDQQPGAGVHRHLLANQAVGAKAAGHNQRYPRNMAVTHDHDQHAGGGDGHGDTLHAPQAFMQEAETEEHVEQRVDVITEAAFQHMRVRHGPDERAPVDADEYCAADQRQQYAAVFNGGREAGAASAEQGKQAEHYRGPDDTVHQDAGYRHSVINHIEVQRQETPQ